jgi:hypothetical protein
MRLNKLCSYASILLSLFFLFCGDERSDIITGAGNDVIKDMDPTLTNIESGFKFIPLVLGEEKEGSVFSIPAKASTNFSTQAASWFMTGVNTKGDTLRANMQFLVSNDTSKYNSRDTRMEAYLHFRAVGDDTTSSGTINVFKSEPLKEITPISGGTVDEADKIGGFELGAIDSIKLADTLAEKIFNARTSDEADTLRFAFSILDYENSVRKINNPYIILRVKKAENESFVRDSIHSAFTFFTAFENGDCIAVRAENPYSSQNTLRTAVFRIDISELIDSANTAAKPSGKYSEVINATLSFKHDETKSDSARYYKYVVLNEPAGSDSLVQNRFTDAAANTLNKNGNNVHSIKPFIRNAIDKQNSKYIYVYLRPTSDHSVIVWDEKSLKVEAVLTPSR